MKKFIASLFFALLFGTQGNALAEPFVSLPQVCQQLALEIMSIAEVRDVGDPESKVMDQLKAAVPESEMAYQFYSFWIKSVYASKMKPEDLGGAFYTACMQAQGDLGKLSGK